MTKEYWKGYNAGVKMGYRSGLQGSIAQLVMKHDLVFIYGTAIIVLQKKHGWTQEQCEEFLSDVQEAWFDIEKEAYDTELMQDYVERVTGVNLVQMTDDVLFMRAEDEVEEENG